MAGVRAASRDSKICDVFLKGKLEGIENQDFSLANVDGVGLVDIRTQEKF